MIAEFLQRLTLIAFTAHAVLGCCWHHSHAMGNDVCHRHFQSVDGASEAGCCAQESDQRTGPATMVQCCHHDGHSHESWRVSETILPQLLCVGDCPCEHSHQCDEAHCNYVPREAHPTEGLVSVSVGDLVPVDANLLALTLVPVGSLDAGRASHLPVKSSRQRCANLQSWQI